MRRTVVHTISLLGCALNIQPAHAQAFSMREVTINGRKVVAVEHFSPDIAKSKDQGFFIEQISVEPKEFQWNDHHVEVRECWLEHTDSTDDNEDQLLLSLTIDGKPDNEHRIAHKKNRFLVLRQDGLVPSVKNISYFNSLPRSRYWRLPFGAFGNYIHYVYLRHPITANLKLQVGTEIDHDHSKDPSPDLKEWTDTVIHFDLLAHPKCSAVNKPENHQHTKSDVTRLDRLLNHSVE